MSVPSPRMGQSQNSPALGFRGNALGDYVNRARIARQSPFPHVIICADFVSSATNIPKKSAITQSMRLQCTKLRVCAISLLFMNTQHHIAFFPAFFVGNVSIQTAEGPP
jgi:hypothetical protein